MSAVLVALIGSCTALLMGYMEYSRRQNKGDHLKGYSLLESIDKRTMEIDGKVDQHSERITAVENEIKHLKPQQVTVSSTVDGSTTVVEAPHHFEESTGGH